MHLYSLQSIAMVSVTSRALLRNIYGWQKAIERKEMTENAHTLNDWRFTCMLDFILTPDFKFGNQTHTVCGVTSECCACTNFFYG